MFFPGGYACPMSTLKQWWKDASAEEREFVARTAGVAVITLYQYGLGTRNPSPAVARKLAAATGLTLAQIRPDIYYGLEAKSS